MSMGDVFGRFQTHLDPTGIVNGPYFRYLSSGDRECSFESRQRLQCIVECTVDMRNININGPVRPTDVSLNLR